MTDFGKRLADQLASRGLNQVAGAKLLGLSQGALSRYLSGQTEPVITTAAAIAARLGIKLADLTGEVPRPPALATVVREKPGSYGRPLPVAPVLAHLKLRWQREKKPKELELAIRVLFQSDADTVLAWLNEP